LIHPIREGRSPRQYRRKGWSNRRRIVGGKLCLLLNKLGLDNLHPDVQHVLDLVESICRHGVDVRSEEEKAWRPKELSDGS
jgi:hypothetical protein